MSTTTTTFTTSNLRGSSSRQTRTRPVPISKFTGSSLRQSSLISNPTLPTAEPHQFLPAIQQFTDAITALPRDYRRHTSLLKEVDAKAWAPEEHLQKLLTQCLAAPPLHPAMPGAQQTGDDRSAVATVGHQPLAPGSVTGSLADNVSQISTQSVVNPEVQQRRHLFAELRHTLFQMMVTMDEKNHVINNANEELSRHIRRLDNIYPHIADEVSEEARLGSLKHWAYFETTVPRKAQTSRREAAASLATMHDTDIAQRSENRREAMLAKKQRFNQQVDSDLDDARPPPRKTLNGKSRRIGDIAIDDPGLNISKKKKPEKAMATVVGMQRSLSNAGAQRMSREPSQQDAGLRKRKAPNVAVAAARKRVNVGMQLPPDPRLTPLFNDFRKNDYTRAPIPPAPRPIPSRMRQNSTQPIEKPRVRPASSASHKTNGHVTASTAQLQDVAVMTGKTTSEVKNTMKETINSRGDKLLEEDGPTDNTTNGDRGVTGGILLERTSSRSSALKREAEDNAPAKSPRIPPPIATNIERTGRGRAASSKTSTPVLGTFAESDASESTVGANGNGHGNKQKRPARPRMKENHSLQDSLSPRALPPKRSHKKGAGLLAAQQGQPSSQPSSGSDRAAARLARDDDQSATATPDVGTEGEEEEEEEEEENGEVEAEDEEKWCYCEKPSYGEMVGCDNDGCLREWFHLECVGLKKAPGDKAKWYCNDCKEGMMQRGRFGSLSQASRNGSGAGNGRNGTGNGISNGNGNGNGNGR